MGDILEGQVLLEGSLAAEKRGFCCRFLEIFFWSVSFREKKGYKERRTATKKRFLEIRSRERYFSGDDSFGWGSKLKRKRTKEIFLRGFFLACW